MGESVVLDNAIEGALMLYRLSLKQESTPEAAFALAVESMVLNAQIAASTAETLLRTELARREN